MRLHLHVPGASPEQLACGLAAAAAVIAAGTEVVQQAGAGDVSKEVASLHALAELAGIDACLAGAPVPQGCRLEHVTLC